MKNKKITLEELKTKTIKCISIRTERREEKSIHNSYNDKLVITKDTIYYWKETNILEEDHYLSGFDSHWDYKGGNPKKEKYFNRLCDALMDLITNKDEEAYYNDVEGTYLSIAFEDGTSIDKDYFVPRKEKFSSVIEAVKFLIPEGAEIPMFCKEEEEE